MPSSIHRALSAIAVVAGSISLTCALSACNAHRRHVPAANVIVVPGRGQVSGTIDASRMDWLSRFISAGSGSAGR